MGTENGHAAPPALAIPLLAVLPPGAHAPQFQLMAQWHTTTGILCPVHNVPVQLLAPPAIVQMFAQLVNSGVVGQIVKDENGADLVVDLPSMNSTMRMPTAPPLESPQEPGIDALEKKWGEGV